MRLEKEDLEIEPSESNQDEGMYEETTLSGAAVDDGLKSMMKLIGQNLENTSIHSGKEHRFWSTQPVPQFSEEESLIQLSKGSAIESNEKKVISVQPVPLLSQFEWCEVDVHSEEQMTELYQLLNENYVEDHDEMFRFDYSKNSALGTLPPGWRLNGSSVFGSLQTKSSSLLSVPFLPIFRFEKNPFRWLKSTFCVSTNGFDRSALPPF